MLVILGSWNVNEEKDISMNHKKIPLRNYSLDCILYGYN